MHRALVATLAILAAGGVACKGKGKPRAKPRVAADAGVPRDGAGGGSEAARTNRAPQITPPIPVATPPPDAEQIRGLDESPNAVIYIKRLALGTGEQPGRNDTVSIELTGWRLNGDTFLTTKSRNRPVQQSLAMLAPGFTAAVATMHVGERAMIWVPPSLGYMGEPQSTPEMLVYEVSLISLERAPATPADLAAPPATATRTKSGLVYEVVKPGDGKTRPRDFDQVTYHYTGWSSRGRIFDSSEIRKRPKPTLVFAEFRGIEEALQLMTTGERLRVWLTPAHVEKMPGLPDGNLCYELELIEVKAMHEPPPVPKDVAGPPADAAKTPKGVSYKVLTKGTGTEHPVASDNVKLDYTGWTTDGHLFDSSIVRGVPATFAVGKVIDGWAEGLEAMVVGDHVRMWIPEPLAYPNQPGRPHGMLVMDVTLLEIAHARTAPAPTPTPAPQVPGPPKPAPTP